MRRRWKWPIIERLALVEPESWALAWLAWGIVGFVCLVMPALLIWTNKQGDPQAAGTPLLWVLIAYAVPLALGALAAMGTFAWFVLDEYGPDLLPRRVTEPVREDLRATSRD